MTIGMTSLLGKTVLPDFTGKAQTKKEQDSFSDALKSAFGKEAGCDTVRLAQKIEESSGITEKGMASTGANELTDVKKQYLKGKYNLGGLSESQFDSLLADLTNLGALSYQDYKLANLTVVYLGPNGVGQATCHRAGEKERNSVSASNNYAAYYRQLNREEQKQIAYAATQGGAEPTGIAGKCTAAHRRIEELLDELMQSM